MPFRDALKEEFKILIDVTNNVRVLKSAHSVYSRSRHSSIDSFDTDSGEESEDNSMEENSDD